MKSFKYNNIPLCYIYILFFFLYMKENNDLYQIKLIPHLLIHINKTKIFTIINLFSLIFTHHFPFFFIQQLSTKQIICVFFLRHFLLFIFFPFLALSPPPLQSSSLFLLFLLLLLLLLLLVMSVRLGL